MKEEGWGLLAKAPKEDKKEEQKVQRKKNRAKSKERKSERERSPLNSYHCFDVNLS